MAHPGRTSIIHACPPSINNAERYSVLRSHTPGCCGKGVGGSGTGGQDVKSRVYLARVGIGGDGTNIIGKVRRLFDEAGLGSCIREGDLTAIKIHFGERGSDAYVRPEYVRQVVEKVREYGGRPFVTDTNTLYNGSRHNAVDHLTTAIEHGFSYGVIGAPVMISDGLCGANYRNVKVCGRHFSEVRIGGDIAEAGSMIVLSHLTGHCMTGFGGAIKNLGMGCAPIAGKADQHRGMIPEVNPATCSACGQCAGLCRRSAITIRATAEIDRALCVGCAECMTGCPTGSIDYNWKRDQKPFMEMLTEYALGAVMGKDGHVGYMTFLLRITPDCDCAPWSDASVVPDIGVLASLDPVAIDAAGRDLVNAQAGIAGTRLQANLGPGQDKFRGLWEMTDSGIQLEYGQEIGLGSASYELIEV